MIFEELCIFELLYPTYKITKPIRLIELFGGIGSQAKALKRLGVNFEYYRLVEFDKYAIMSYNAIHDTNFQTTDIRDIHARDLGIIDTKDYEYIMTYSFPCQDLSIAGKQKGMKKGKATRSSLLWEVERLLDECNELPQILLMENVPEVIGEKNINDFKLWQLKLEKLGYSNYVELLNAKDYEIPQNRNRCFMISILGKYNYTFPAKKPLKLRFKDILEDPVDDKYYLSKKMYEYCMGVNQKASWFSRKDRFLQTLKTINTTGIAVTITTRVGNSVIDNFVIDRNGRIRKLTIKECWRLMGFDDEDIDKAQKVNSNTQLYKQAGNSIVVNVLEAIFKQLF